MGPPFPLEEGIMERVLMGIRKGCPDYAEEVLTDRPEQFDAAREWARGQGFDRFRVMEVDLSTPPDFTKAIRGGR